MRLVMDAVPSWVMPLRVSPATTPLFLVHPVGGSAMAYLWLADALDERPCFGIEARTLHGAGEDRTIEEAAHGYATAIRDIQPAGPYALGGWSMGAAIAFEVARVLSDAGELMCPVALIDPDPDWADPPLVGERAVVAAFVSDLLRQSVPAAQVAETREQVMAGVDGPGSTRLVVARLSSAGLIPGGSQDLVEARVAAFRALTGAYSAYRPDPAAVAATLISSRGGAPRQLAAWRRLATAGCTQHVRDADHYSILGPAHATTVAAAIVGSLRVAVGTGTTAAPSGPG